MTDRHYAELIKAALNDRPDWVPRGPMEAARHRKLTDLEREGLITLTPRKDKSTAMIRLTEAGKQVVLTMPDNLHADWFPLPIDIARAKARLR